MKKALVVLVGLVFLIGFAVAESEENSSVSSPDGKSGYGQIESTKTELRSGESFVGEYEKNGVIQKFKVTLLSIFPPTQECSARYDDPQEGERDCWEVSAKARFNVEGIGSSTSTIWGNGSTQFSLEPGMRVPTIEEQENYALSFFEIKKGGSAVLNFEKTPCPVKSGSATQSISSSPGNINGCGNDLSYGTRGFIMKEGDTIAEEYNYNDITKRVWVTLKKNIDPAPDKCSPENIATRYSNRYSTYTCMTEYALIEVKTETSDNPAPVIREFEFKDTLDKSKAIIFDEYVITLIQNSYGEADFSFPNLPGVKPIEQLPTESENSEIKQEDIIEGNEINSTQSEFDEAIITGDYLKEEVEKMFPKDIEIEASDNRLFVKSRGEKKELKILPSEVKKELKTKENLDCENIELSEKQDSLAYTCKTRQTGKLFGLIPMEFEVTAEVNAEEEAEAMVSKPWWSFLVFQ